MIVKICGLTRVEDAVQAASLGATAIGLVFWPSSPRRVSVALARDIAGAVPASVLKVGVFVNASRGEIERTVVDVGLDVVQLHGDESSAFARALGIRFIKAIGLGPASDDTLFAGWDGATVLLDAHDPVRRGGTGTPVDWDRAARLARRHELILAGGLTPATIAHAVRAVRPAGVDVSSGVELEPGIKDHIRLASLFGALAGVEAAQ
jgi:phosphoribosylanthranilate isomerase